MGSELDSWCCSGRCLGEFDDEGSMHMGRSLEHGGDNVVGIKKGDEQIGSWNVLHCFDKRKL